MQSYIKNSLNYSWCDLQGSFIENRAENSLLLINAKNLTSIHQHGKEYL